MQDWRELRRIPYDSCPPVDNAHVAAPIPEDAIRLLLQSTGVPWRTPPPHVRGAQLPLALGGGGAALIPFEQYERLVDDLAERVSGGGYHPPPPPPPPPPTPTTTRRGARIPLTCGLQAHLASPIPTWRMTFRRNACLPQRVTVNRALLRECGGRIT